MKTNSYIFKVVTLIYIFSILIYGLKLGWTPSDETAVWGQFGDFLGGFINPAIGIATIYLLLESIKQNDEALRQSAKELELTREELKRGQQIQKATEESLRNQIEINEKNHDLQSISILYKFYDEKIDEVEEKIIERRNKVFTDEKSINENLARINIGNRVIEGFKKNKIEMEILLMKELERLKTKYAEYDLETSHNTD